MLLFPSRRTQCSGTRVDTQQLDAGLPLVLPSANRPLRLHSPQSATVFGHRDFALWTAPKSVNRRARSSVLEYGLAPLLGSFRLQHSFRSQDSKVSLNSVVIRDELCCVAAYRAYALYEIDEWVGSLAAF